MGLMQRLRKNMPGVIIFLIVMFVLLIVVEWGDAKLGGSGARGRSSTAIGEVNGDEISATEYQKRVSDVIEQQKQSNPDGEIDDDQIRQMVWQQLVDEKLIRQAADRMGIYISDEELAEALLYDPPPGMKQQFSDSTGVFNEAMYLEFMTNTDRFLLERKFPDAEIKKVKESLFTAQESLRQERLRQAVESVVTASAIPSPAEALSIYKDQKAKGSGSYVLIDAMAIADSTIPISDDEVKSYYEAHKGDFQQKESREVRYVLFNLAPSAQDSASNATRLRDATRRVSDAQQRSKGALDSTFEDLLISQGGGEYTGKEYTPLQKLSAELQAALIGTSPGAVIGPIQLTTGTSIVNVVDVKDSGDPYVKAQHILLRTMPTDNDDSVKALATKLYQRVKGGESFEELAQQFSADGSAQRGGDLGYFAKGAMVPEFDAAAFNNPAGSTVGPIKTQFGYHIIRVNDRSTRSYKLRDLAFGVRTSNPTKNLLRNKAKQFRDQIADGNKSIDSLAAPQKLQVLESGPITPMTAAGGSIQLTSFAYAGKVGDVSEVIPVAEGNLLVGQISKVRSAGTMTMEDAKETIKTKLRLAKKLAILKPKAEKLRASLQQGDSLSKLSMIDSTAQVRSFTDVSRVAAFPGVGYEPALSNAVFSLNPGQISDLIRGERGYYIAVVNSRSLPTDAEFQTEREKFIQQLITQRRQAMYQEWLARERERAVIKDYRSNQN